MRKYTELLTIPAALVLLIAYNFAAEFFGLHTIALDQVGKVFTGFVLFLVIVGFARITLLFVFPTLYKYFDPSFKENGRWKDIEPKERTKYALYLYVAFILAFALILSGL